ncbi:enoyl-CoA hydratase/isomerase family protein [Streptomyces griseorubiginosus]|uniref:enoyl-CoA hydratase/isomerase family protein n=1 Tax=Streptomyces griseorubiginosus TaxID=67304 RepID=UPI001AD61EBD|nr:enoyl-CoA hydratase/isomerase family protein [Streptomyces griseorubiginosus]MBO4254637.1 enoyl-CoA hydratase/isomerase family protein [Streptomyces griseorubiginosus]
MTNDAYSTLRVSSEHGVARIVLDNPPVNALGTTMMRELRTVLTGFKDDSSIRVIVFSSADPEFFIAHVDMHIGEEMDVLQELAASAPADVNVFQAIGELIRHQPQVTIVKLAGKARGGGAEFVAAADMTFAAIETAGLGQIEALMGIIPGGGGTQYLRDRVGRNRALEVVLTADLFDAETAASYGWINRALPADELDGYVDRVARNIAALPDGVIEAAKSALPADDFKEGLLRENEAWASTFSRPAAQHLISGGLQDGAQTPAGEHDLEGLMRSVAR